MPNTPYNVNRKIVTFGDFASNINSEKEELEKVKRTTIKNDVELQQKPGNTHYKFNKVTRKMDDISPAMVDDQLDAIEELEESFNGNDIPDFYANNTTWEIVEQLAKRGGDIGNLAKAILDLASR